MMKRKPNQYWSRAEVVGILVGYVEKRIEERQAEERMATLPEGPVGPGDVKWYANELRKAQRFIAKEPEAAAMVRTLLEVKRRGPR